LLEQRLVYGRSYFLGYVRYGGLLEEDIRGKGETSGGVEQGWMVWGGRSTQFVVAISINAANENVGYPEDKSIGYVFEHGYDRDVALFAGHHEQICREVGERPV